MVSRIPRFITAVCAAAFLAWPAVAAPTSRNPEPSRGPVVTITDICGDQEPDRRLAATPPDGPAAARLQKRRQRHMRRLLALSDSHIGSYTAQNCLARILLSFSEPKKALAVAERAVRLAPRDMDPVILRGIARLQTGYRDGAALDADEVLKNSPRNKGAADLYWRATGRRHEKAP